MQGIENWSHITGTVERWVPPSHPDAPGELVVIVARVDSVSRDGRVFPRLVANPPGTAVRVKVPASTAAALAVAAGDLVSLEVRRVRDPTFVFAHPDRIRVTPRAPA